MRHPIDAHGFLAPLAEDATLTVKLPAPKGEPHPPRHVLDADSLNAINAALAARRPLLVRGEPGTGKSQLAQAAAVLLGRAFISHAVDARTDTHDLLFTVDHVSRLAKAQLLGALGKDAAVAEQQVAIGRFTRPGALWWAFDWEGAEQHGQKTPHHAPANWTPAAGCVVLIDEIDKADATVPNGLLDALGHQRFDVPGDQTVHMKPDGTGRPPLVIITTNEERSLPDAFLRRCLVLHLELPEGDDLVDLLKQRGCAHFPEYVTPEGQDDDPVLTRAATLLVADREKSEQLQESPPGTAEFIDLLRVITTMKATQADRLALLDTMATYALKKHPRPKGQR